MTHVLRWFVYENSCANTFYGAILTGKTWSADDDPTGQNDRQAHTDALCWGK